MNLHHSINSSVPNWFDSMPSHASSGLVVISVFFAHLSSSRPRTPHVYLGGLLSRGPIPSSQWYVATKFPPGYLTTGMFRVFNASATSRRNPRSSANGLPGSYIPPYMALPMCLPHCWFYFQVLRKKTGQTVLYEPPIDILIDGRQSARWVDGYGRRLRFPKFCEECHD